MDRLTGYLVAARDGDELALAAAIRTAQPEVRRFLRPLADASDLEDVVQDTFVRAYRALPRFRGESSGRTWLLVIARQPRDSTRIAPFRFAESWTVSRYWVGRWVR